MCFWQASMMAARMVSADEVRTGSAASMMPCLPKARSRESTASVTPSVYRIEGVVHVELEVELPQVGRHVGVEARVHAVLERLDVLHRAVGAEDQQRLVLPVIANLPSPRYFRIMSDMMR